MILYTTLPLELVLAGMDEHQPNYHEMEIDGITMIVEMTNMQQGRIVRMISPNPYDYLNPLYAPGEMVSLSPRIVKQ